MDQHVLLLNANCTNTLIAIKLDILFNYVHFLKYLEDDAGLLIFFEE